MDNELLQILERIAQALECIADYLEKHHVVEVPFDDLEGEWDVTAPY